MKRITGLIVAVFAIVVSGVSWANIAHAQTFNPKIAKGDTVDSSLYVASQDVVVDGVVNGDVHCVGQSVTINGTINGDVLCAGQHLRINGTVNGNIRVAAQEVTIAGKVTRGATIAGDKVTIERDARIGRDVTIASSNAVVNGSIGRDAVLASGQAQVDNKIGRNLRFDGAALRLKDAAMIGGSLTYTSEKAVDKASGAYIGGSTDHKAPKKSTMPWGLNAAEAITMLLALVLFSMALVLLLPRAVHATSQVAVKSLGKSILIGLASLLAVPLLIAVLASTIVGMPLAFLVGILGLILLLISGPITAYYLGSMFLAKSKNPIHMMLLGSVVLVLLYMVPVVGVIVMFAAYLIGSGAILIAIKRNLPKPVYEVK